MARSSGVLQSLSKQYWVEVGPGAIGTLTRMILNDPAAHVVAIEANVGAARSLCRRSDIQPFIREGRLQVSSPDYLRGREVLASE